LQWVDCAALECVVKGPTPEVTSAPAENLFELLRKAAAAFDKTDK
jgi:hypothetical protein